MKFKNGDRVYIISTKEKGTVVNGWRSEFRTSVEVRPDNQKEYAEKMRPIEKYQTSQIERGAITVVTGEDDCQLLMESNPEFRDVWDNN